MTEIHDKGSSDVVDELSSHLGDLGDAKEMGAFSRYFYTLAITVFDREMLATKVYARDWKAVSKPLAYNAATILIASALLYFGKSDIEAHKISLAGAESIRYAMLVSIPFVLINHLCLSLISPNSTIFDPKAIYAYGASFAYCLANLFLWAGIVSVIDRYVFHILQDGPVFFAIIGVLLILTLPLAFVEEIYGVESSAGFYCFVASIVGLGVLFVKVYPALGLI